MADKVVFRTIREQVAHRLRLDILARRLPEGASLREQSLAEQYGVSRAPIRDALLQLTQEGLLVARPNCGVRVSPALEASIQPLVVDLRQRIEVFALKRLFSRVAEPYLGGLEEVLERLRRACKRSDPAAIVAEDMAFHRCLIEMSGARELVVMWLPIVARMMLCYRRHRDWMDSYAEHAAIVEAIRRGDRKQAIRALKENIR